MESTLISLKNVKMSFGDITILKDISFSVKEGERMAMVGPGGCGKSTILKILLGLMDPDAGEVRMLDTDMVNASADKKLLTLRRVGMAFQQGALFDFMTVRQNLMFAMENMTDMLPDQREDKSRNLLDGVKLGRTGNMFPHELSGGMQRRVGIARALCTEPTVAIFDEPTAGLDPVTSTIILNMILDLGGDSTRGCQMVVTSNVEIGIRFADRLIVVNEGTVVADGPWRELLLTGPDWVKHFLSVRLIGLDLAYAKELDLPPAFVEEHWRNQQV